MNRTRKRFEPLWALLAAAFVAAPGHAQAQSAAGRAPAAQDAQAGAAREDAARASPAREERGGEGAISRNPFLGPHPTLAPLLHEVMPAVVNISVADAAAAPPTQGETPQPNDRGHRFFDQTQQAPQQSVGSGVIVDARKGLIVTNAHVVIEGPDIVVTLADRRRLKATLIGSDEATDIAVLRVDAAGLTEVSYGDSTKLQVGDFVVAIGNPFGLGQTATLGIVSALGRGLDIEGYEDFIQTDASINPGNSGGALLDLEGRLMGMSTAIVSPGGGNVGIGFAIPSEMVQSVVTQLVENGEVRRGRLGVFIQDVTPGLAEALELGTDRGALVTEIQPGSSAATAGLEVGDVVTAVDDKPIETASELRNSIGLMPLGGTVELTLLRDGRTLTKNVRIGEPPPEASGTQIEQIPGAEFSDVPPGEDARAGVTQGARVDAVQLGSPAERLGLKPNDVVTAVNRKPVSSVEDLAAAIAAAGDTVALRVERDGRPAYVLIQ